MPKFGDRLQHAWNAFMGRDPTPPQQKLTVGFSNYRPDRPHLSMGNDRSIVNTVYNRIAIDAAAISIQHVKVDENGHYLETVNSGLNNALTLEANIDQTGRMLIQDVVMSMCDEGVVALVPTDTDISPLETGGYDILKMRTGSITQWYPEYVKVRVYNERTGNKEEVVLPKSMVAIIENPLYSVMNEPNSTLKRLVRSLANLDVINQQNASGKLDLIIQLPYIINNDRKREQAETRRKDIEAQLTGTKYGIAYADGSERITQLNRPIENQLWQQIKDLTEMLYSQLGMTPEVFNGTADESVMLNYYNRTIEPILSAITDEMQRKFLTKTARTKRHAIKFYRDPFRLVPAGELAEIANVLTQTEVLSSNEVRAMIGYKPVDTQRANELINKSINPSEYGMMPEEASEEYDPTGDIDDIESQYQELLAEIERSTG